jgi:flagellar biosynthesis protein FlhA
MPPVRILDNMRLATQGYAIRIKEMEAGAGRGAPRLADGHGPARPPGRAARRPCARAGLRPAGHLDRRRLREEATFRGYTIVDPATVLTTHLTEILKDNMADLLSYAEVQKLLKDLPAEQKKLVDDWCPRSSPSPPSSACCRPCCASASRSATCRHPRRRRRGRAAHQLDHPAGRARPHPAGRSCAGPDRGDDGALPIVTLSPDWEIAFSDALIGQGEDKQLAMAPSRKLQEFIRGVREAFERAALAGDARCC